MADVLASCGSTWLSVAAVLAFLGLAAARPCLPVLAMLPLELLKLPVSHPIEPLQYHRHGATAERVCVGHVQPSRASSLGKRHTGTADSA